jgi:hypothetical protein
LYPGDYFTPGGSPAIKGDCTDKDLRAIEYAKAHEMRLESGRLAHKGKLDEALKLIDASINHIQPAACDAYIDRAHLYARKGEVVAAKRDVEVFKTRKCEYGGSLNFLLLHELGNELRTQKQFKTAVEVLGLALVHCGGSDLCKPGIEKDLAAAKANK